MFPIILIPDIDAFEERAAITQYDGGLSRSLAEDLAAQAQGSPMPKPTGSGWPTKWSQRRYPGQEKTIANSCPGAFWVLG